MTLRRMVNRNRKFDNDEFMAHQAFLFKCYKACAIISMLLVLVEVVFLIVKEDARWYCLLYFTVPAFLFIWAAFIIKGKMDKDALDAYIGGKPIE